MNIITSLNEMKIPLYHGTSSLFLDEIFSKGLGARNPVVDLKVLEISQAIYKLSEEYISQSELFIKCSASFKKMVEQSQHGMNYKHGQSYLSPSKITACNYAIQNKYGSEIISYIFRFIEELILLDKHLITDLVSTYPEFFILRKLRTSPILLEVKKIPISNIEDEYGRNPQSNIEYLEKIIKEDHFEILNQQTNFRLKEAAMPIQITPYLINHVSYNNQPIYKLLSISYS